MELNCSLPLTGPILTLGAAVAMTGSLSLQAQALVITPFFDSSITSSGSVAAIEGAINAAVNRIDGLYTNPGTVGIVFNTAAGSFLGQSQSADYQASYNTVKADLTADAVAHPTNSILSAAVANLASGNDANGARNILGTSAWFRVALGEPGATGCFNSSGTFVGLCGQSYDAVITLSSSQSFFYTEPTPNSPFGYDAVATIEHEINEILGGGGQGSVLNAIQQGFTAYNNFVGPLDLYRYAAPGTPSFTTSAGATAYFSVDGGTTNITGFNQSSSGDYADFLSNNSVQSAFTANNQTPAYTTASPEFIMLEAIGYNGVPEPASITLLAPALAGLRLMRRRPAAKVPAVPTSPPG